MTKKATTQKTEKAEAPVAGALSSSDRRSMRAQAHHLEPVVQVGHSGVTDAVIAAVKEQLRAHELIKVRLHEPEDKKGMAEALAAGSGSTLCGLVGHTAILYKKHRKPSAATQKSAALRASRQGGRAQAPGRGAARKRRSVK